MTLAMKRLVISLIRLPKDEEDLKRQRRKNARIIKEHDLEAIKEIELRSD